LRIKVQIESCSRVFSNNRWGEFGENRNSNFDTDLEWKDVDFERRMIKISPRAGWTPKGKRGREISVNNELLTVLLKLQEKAKGRHVVEKTNDKPYNRGLWLNFKPWPGGWEWRM
jgi:hypothetical protein